MEITMGRLKWKTAFFAALTYGASFQAKAQQGIVLLESSPAGAEVRIETGSLTGKTPWQQLLEPGTYRFELHAPRHRVHAGHFRVEPGQTTRLRVELIPAFGTLHLQSNPPGALISIDGRATGKRTPASIAELPSGSHTVLLQLEMHEPRLAYAEIHDGKTTELVLDLLGEFGTIGIVARPEAEIWLDGKKIGTAHYSGRMAPGRYEAEARKAGFYGKKEIIYIEKGRESSLVMDLEPITGSLAIITDVADQPVWLDGTLAGRTPVMLGELQIGWYHVGIGREDKVIAVEIRERELSKLELEMAEVPELRIWQSGPGLAASTSGRAPSMTIVDNTGAAAQQWSASPTVRIAGELERGFAWSHAGSEKAGDIRIFEPLSTGDFSNNPVARGYERPWYVRAFIKTNAGIWLSPPVLYVYHLADVEGNLYKTIWIGEQLWMAENLKATRYKTGEYIPKIGKNGSWIETNAGAWCWYDNEQANLDSHGALYNWHVVNKRLVCPTGWHVPTSEEWKDMLGQLGGPGTAGIAMMDIKGGYWREVKGDYSNRSGFSALPGGYRSGNVKYPGHRGKFWDKGYKGYWWSSGTALEPSTNQILPLYAIIDNSAKWTLGQMIPTTGMSIRCMSDQRMLMED